MDYGIHCGGRSFDDQLKEYLEGDSSLDPRVVPEKCTHMIWEKNPLSTATDIHIASKKYAFHSVKLCYLQMELEAFADKLYRDDAITHKLNWIGKHYVQGRTSFKDFPHTQLIPVIDI